MKDGWDNGSHQAVDNGSHPAVDNGSHLAVDNGSHLAVDNGSHLAVDNGSHLAVDNGSHLVVDNGSHQAVDNGSHLLIPGSLLTVVGVSVARLCCYVCCKNTCSTCQGNPPSAVSWAGGVTSPVSPGNKRLSPGLTWELGVEEESGVRAIPQLLGARDVLVS